MAKEPEKKSEDEEEVPPVEPSGKALTQKRTDQAKSKKAAQKSWDAIIALLQNSNPNTK